MAKQKRGRTAASCRIPASGERSERWLNRFPQMVQLDYQRRLRQVMAARQERLAALKTRGDAERYVLAARRAVRRAFGPLPPRTPLNARLTRACDLADHRVEHILLESRPGFLVTGNLYLPGGAQPGNKLPAMLGLCGHSADGKMAAGYQSFCLELVQQGFVVFIIDPIQQGERIQYTPQDGPPIGLCAAHNMMGNQMSLVNDFFGTWRVWDAIRALDYLWSRPEIDRTRVGVTGNSGGGTLTTYVTALDPRPAWAAPSCYISSWLANLENELPADSEQNPPGLLAAGLDEADLLLCYAPRPTLILGQAKDFFDPRYTRKAWEEVRHVHTLLGSPRSAELFIGPTVHGFSPENRAAMVDFSLKQVGKRRAKATPAPAPVDARDLWVTPAGSTLQAGSVRVFERTAARAEELARKRGRPSAGQVIKDARRLLAIGTALPALPYRALRGAGGGPTVGIRGQFAVETEPGIEAIVSAYGDFADAMLPPSGAVTLYVGHVSADADVHNLPAVGQLACKPGFVTVDPRGIGQSQPRTCASMDFFEPYGPDFLYASLGEMLNQSYLGRRVFDVMRTIDFLLAYGASEVSLVGRGLGATTAAFAALLHPSRPRVRLLNYLPSYTLLTQSPQFAWPLSSLLRGCLTCFDLPDVYRALGRRLRLDDPWDAAMQAPGPKTATR